MRVAIGITTYRPPGHKHGPAFTKRLRVCLPSVARLRDYGHEIDVIVVDDGSEVNGPHHQWLIDLCKTYGFEWSIWYSNSGVAQAKNRCLRWIEPSKYDIGFLLDDDVEIIGDLAGFYDQRMRETGVQHAGYWSAEYGWIPHEYVTLNRVPIVKCGHTNGVCLAFRPVMLTAVGAFRVLPEKWGCEHVDWTARAVKAGLMPYPLDMIGSDRYLQIQPLDRISTVTNQEKRHMTAVNQSYSDSCADIYIPL